MIDRGLLQFVLESLPPAPARVLEVGAGDGELAGAMRSSGYEVVAIDPASDAGGVLPIALLELREPPGSFDAAVAVVSMHHLEPLDESCAHLAELVRREARLLADEFDVERFDELAARWWLDHRERHDGPGTPAEVVADLRHHCHPLADVRRALAEWFELSAPVRGPYLYRWDLVPSLRAEEEQEIAADRLPATGARFTGTRR